MFEIKKNKKNKSAVILNPERSEWVSRSHVTGVEPVVNAGAKTKRYSAKRDLYARSPNGSRLKMTEKTLSFLRLRGASGAQGISTLALCLEAHKRRFLFNSWILRFANAPLRMTIPTLALLFTLATTTESRADCENPTNGICKTLEEKGTCGEGCSYTYDSATQTVYITATGDNAKIAGAAFHSHRYENNSMPAKTFVVNGAVTVGSNAFTASSEVISGAGGVLTLNGLGHHAFGNTTLSGTIIIPEGAKFDSLAFYEVTLADNAKIYCGVENCKQKMIDSCNAWGDETNPSRISCLNAVNSMGDKLLAYPDGCAKMGASGCTKCKNSNFKLNDGECDRLRYTPAEAAKVLTDDNNNSVTITFKK